MRNQEGSRRDGTHFGCDQRRGGIRSKKKLWASHEWSINGGMNPPAGRPTVQLQCEIRGPPSDSKLVLVISSIRGGLSRGSGDCRQINGWIPEIFEKR